MNLTELARKLRVSPNELKELLPEFGFDIGKKAIKIDENTARKILAVWSRLYDERKSKKDEEKKLKEKAIRAESKVSVIIPSFITVRDFAALAQLPANAVISELMKNGIFASLNQKIDFDTAAIVGADLGFDVQQSTEDGSNDEDINKIQEVLDHENRQNLRGRPPVIVVMGHVDHGKTKLLDAIRRTDVVTGEAGGITQHIGAYQVTRRQRLITFIDTPGHEAFTAMRSRGAKVADVAILVVAADDGVKPQTIEAYRIIEAAKIPFIVAINKIDKPEANIDKTKQELSGQLNINPEDWGGKTTCMPVSALAGQGIEDLLDMILLKADMEAENIQANPESKAIGTIIESRIDKGEGPVATILIQNGTLKIGDTLTFQNQIFGKVRALKNYLGESVESALPSTPVKIIGLKAAPVVGDILEVGLGERVNLKKMARQSDQPSISSSASSEKSDDEIKYVNLLIKCDVFGSAEAIEESLEKINTAEVKAKIIYKGLGNITEGDVKRAEASGALIIGFNVKTPPQIMESVRIKNVEIKNYNIIYDLLNEVKTRMLALVSPAIKRVDLGKLSVLAVFKSDRSSQIIGGKVIDGRIETDSSAVITRNGAVLDNGKILKLQSGKQDVRDCDSGSECGVQLVCASPVAIGDILEVFKEEELEKKL